MKKKSTTLLMLLSIVLYYGITITIVYAGTPDNVNTYGRVMMNGATSLENKDDVNEVVATYEHGTVAVSGGGLYSDGTQVYATGNVTVDCLPNASYTCELWKDGVKTNESPINLQNVSATDIINIDATFSLTPNTQSTIVVSPGTGTYEIPRPNPQTGEPELVQEAYNDQIELSINGTHWDSNSPTIHYYADGDTVTFTFETLWINRYYESLVINGHEYPIIDYIDFDDRTSWLNHNHGSQMVSFDIPNVPKADTYNIVAKHGENNGTRFLSTFLWTADPAQAGGNNYIGNAKLELVKAEYYVGNQNYTVTENDIENNLVREGDHLVFTSADGFMSYGVMADVNFDDGNITLPGEARVTMRVVPDYGYQVTSVNGGANFQTTDEGVSEFTVVVHHGEAGYFQAEVTEVANEVKANSEKVTAGTVKIANDEIDSGTVRLYVDDVELSNDKIKGFESAAGEYTISNYLDINLSQVFYKGDDVGEDVWDEQIHHLNKEATITLKLAKGIDVNDVVIVHNIDNGDEYEVIEIESYNPKTRVITFKTKSFSNYAIAFKNGSNPNTADNIIFYIVLLGLSVLGLICVVIVLKRNLLINN